MEKIMNEVVDLNCVKTETLTEGSTYKLTTEDFSAKDLPSNNDVLYVSIDHHGMKFGSTILKEDWEKVYKIGRTPILTFVFKLIGFESGVGVCQFISIAYDKDAKRAVRKEVDDHFPPVTIDGVDNKTLNSMLDFEAIPIIKLCWRTRFVIVPSKDYESDITIKAKKLGIPIITPLEACDKLGLSKTFHLDGERPLNEVYTK